ncbi:MAG: hypothetical protein A07HR60_01084 [uncultured archaeon A07HR60]|nr:MAG: hypothetical protein J07HR59_00466 [Halorubrum sp. J07HR59]ESS12144.1 MAG: hypothetical protein A07HR60_01084 [uncultured archaeon A07HR60]
MRKPAAGYRDCLFGDDVSLRLPRLAELKNMNRPGNAACRLVSAPVCHWRTKFILHGHSK